MKKNKQGDPEYTHEKTGIVFVRLPGRKFEMGSPASEAERGGDEGPIHEVTLSPFLIAKHEVTLAQYAQVMQGHPTLDPNPSYFTGDDQQPVEMVSWDDLKSADGFLARTVSWHARGSSYPRRGSGNMPAAAARYELRSDAAGRDFGFRPVRPSP